MTNGITIQMSKIMSLLLKKQKTVFSSFPFSIARQIQCPKQCTVTIFSVADFHKNHLWVLRLLHFTMVFNRLFIFPSTKALTLSTFSKFKSVNVSLYGTGRLTPEASRFGEQVYNGIYSRSTIQTTFCSCQLAKVNFLFLSKGWLDQQVGALWFRL